MPRKNRKPSALPLEGARLSFSRQDYRLAMLRAVTAHKALKYRKAPECVSMAKEAGMIAYLSAEKILRTENKLFERSCAIEILDSFSHFCDVREKEEEDALFALTADAPLTTHYIHPLGVFSNTYTGRRYHQIRKAEVECTGGLAELFYKVKPKGDDILRWYSLVDSGVLTVVRLSFVADTVCVENPLHFDLSSVDIVDMSAEEYTRRRIKKELHNVNHPWVIDCLDYSRIVKESIDKRELAEKVVDGKPYVWINRKFWEQENIDGKLTE